MKKRATKHTEGPRRAPRDAQVAEFERRDLGNDIRGAGVSRLLRPRPKPTSIMLDAEIVAKLREKGASRGLGYQTMLKLIVREHVGEY